MSQQPVRSRQRAGLPHPRGFTLIELLIVIVIIGMLAGMVLGGLSAARETARKAKTRATIAKIDKIIMAKYESYRTRRLPLRAADMRAIAVHLNYWTPGQPYSAYVNARVRMNAIRDLMRMEMPDRWNDVIDATAGNAQVRPPLVLYDAAGNPLIPALAQRYANVFIAATARPLAQRIEYGEAECLYQIVMSTPDAASQFQENEIGDVDSDGLKEFHDAWGQPIFFIRWPAGFFTNSRHTVDSELQSWDRIDPFDPNQIMGAGTNADQPGQSYALYPLICSRGPDGERDINLGMDGSGGIYRYVLSSGGNNNGPMDLIPYLFDQGVPPAQIGEPGDWNTNGAQGYYDNIHNHHLQMR
jgi:prepilin-type N-terminal cleavage/methylation domain-containing protein